MLVKERIRRNKQVIILLRIKNMIKNIRDASIVINAAISSHRSVWKDAKDTELYLIKMDRPFDEEKLKEKGVNWQSNWNYGKGRAQVEQIASKNAQEVVKAISFSDIEFKNFDPKKHSEDPIYEFLLSPETRADFGERISSAFSETIIERNSKIDTLVKRAEYEGIFGFATYLQPSNNIFPTVIPYRDIAFEDHTDVDDIKKFVVFDLVKGSYLYEMYSSLSSEPPSEDKTYCYSDGLKDCPTFTDSGWNLDALNHIICEIFNTNETALQFRNPGKEKDKDGKYPLKYTVWEDVSLLEQEYGSYWCQVNMNNVYLARIYEIECGEIHESWCAIQGPVSDDVGYIASTRADILFYRKYTKKQEELVNIVRDISVEGSVYIEDIQGIGKIIAESALRYDIYRNTLNDKLTLNGSTWIYSPNGLVGKNMEVQVLGGLVVAGQGTEIVPNMIRQDLSDHVMALQMENSEHQENIKHVQPNQRLSNRPTKDEVNFINSESSAVRSADLPQKVKVYSIIITNLINNLSSEDLVLTEKDKHIKEEFFQKLEYEFSDLSVDREDLVKILKSISRVIVSPVMSDREAISAAMSIASSAQARKRLERNMLSTFGYTRCQIKAITDSEEYARDAELASIENAMFESTREVVFSRGQDHIIHLQAHFYKVDQKFGGLQAGEDPVRAHLYITNALTNTKLHVNAIANSPFYKDKAKDFIDTQNYFEQKLQQLAQKLDQAKQKAQQEGQEGGQPKLSPEDQQKFYLDRIKLMEKIKTARERTAAMQEMKLQTWKIDQALKQERVKADIENKKTKTNADVDASLAKKSVDMVTRG